MSSAGNIAANSSACIAGAASFTCKIVLLFWSIGAAQLGFGFANVHFAVGEGAGRSRRSLFKMNSKPTVLVAGLPAFASFRCSA